MSTIGQTPAGSQTFPGGDSLPTITDLLHQILTSQAGLAKQLEEVRSDSASISSALSTLKEDNTQLRSANNDLLTQIRATEATARDMTRDTLHCIHTLGDMIFTLRDVAVADKARSFSSSGKTKPENNHKDLVSDLNWAKDQLKVLQVMREKWDVNSRASLQS